MATFSLEHSKTAFFSSHEYLATLPPSGWGIVWVKYAQLHPALWEKIRLLHLVF